MDLAIKDYVGLRLHWINECHFNSVMLHGLKNSSRAAFWFASVDSLVNATVSVFRIFTRIFQVFMRASQGKAYQTIFRQGAGKCINY